MSITKPAVSLRERLLVMHPRVLRLVAQRYYLAGFAASGQGMNGETVDVRAESAVVRLLRAEFSRLWKERR